MVAGKLSAMLWKLGCFGTDTCGAARYGILEYLDKY